MEKKRGSRSTPPPYSSKARSGAEGICRKAVDRTHRASPRAETALAARAIIINAAPDLRSHERRSKNPIVKRLKKPCKINRRNMWIQMFQNHLFMVR